MTTEKATGLPEPTEAQKKAAAKEGVTEALKENAKAAYNSSHDGVIYGDPDDAPRFQGPFEVARLEYILDLRGEDMDAALDADAPGITLTDHQVAGLLEAERAGKNRTDVVKRLLKRLGVKGAAIGEVTGAGPGYTNDVTNVSKL